MEFNTGDSYIKNEYTNSLKYMLMENYLYGIWEMSSIRFSIGETHATGEAGKRHLAYNEFN